MGYGNTAFADFAYGDGTSTFPTPPTPPNGKRRTFVTSLNVLAGTFVTGHSLLDEAGAANRWAGTTRLDLLGALNAKAGTVGLGLDAVCNKLASTTGLDAPGALTRLATTGTPTTAAQAFVTGGTPIQLPLTVFGSPGEGSNSIVINIGLTNWVFEVPDGTYATAADVEAAILASTVLKTTVPQAGTGATYLTLSVTATTLTIALKPTMATGAAGNTAVLPGNTGTGSLVYMLGFPLTQNYHFAGGHT